MQCFRLIFLIQVVFNYLVVQRKKKSLSVSFMQERDKISVTGAKPCCLFLTCLKISSKQKLYRLFLLCPATYNSFLFDAILLNILWLQRVPGMNFSESQWCRWQDNLKISVLLSYGYTAVQRIVSQAGIMEVNSGEGEGTHLCDFTQV